MDNIFYQRILLHDERKSTSDYQIESVDI